MRPNYSNSCEANSSSVEKFPDCYGTGRFITACHVPVLNLINSVHAFPSHCLKITMQISNIIGITF